MCVNCWHKMRQMLILSVLLKDGYILCSRSIYDIINLLFDYKNKNFLPGMGAHKVTSRPLIIKLENNFKKVKNKKKTVLSSMRSFVVFLAKSSKPGGEVRCENDIFLSAGVGWN